MSEDLELQVLRTRIFPILLLGLTVLSIMPIHGAIDQLFFDDFLSSNYPAQWATGIPNNLNPSSQTGGYFTLTELASNLKVALLSMNAAIANASAPITGNGSLNNATDGQFVDMVWKLVPTNMTSSGNGVTSSVELIFGISDASCLNCGFNGLIGFDLFQKNTNLGNQPVGTQINFDIIDPNLGATSCFSAMIFLSTGCKPGIQYATQSSSGPNSPSFDFGQSHIFTIQMKLYPVSQKSWIAFNVDGDAWMNITQTACSCIDGPSTKYVKMFPSIWIGYDGVGGGCCVNIQPAFSLGTSVDYVIVTDYVPVALPSGQLLSSNINPPKTNQGIYQNGGFSLTQYVQYESWSMGQGNIYAGGTLLTGLFLLIISIGLGGVYYKIRMVNIVGWIWNISTISLIFFMFYCGVIPLLYPVITVLGGAAIAFGIVRSGPTGRAGGEVPD